MNLLSVYDSYLRIRYIFGFRRFESYYYYGAITIISSLCTSSVTMLLPLSPVHAQACMQHNECNWLLCMKIHDRIYVQGNTICQHIFDLPANCQYIAMQETEMAHRKYSNIIIMLCISSYFLDVATCRRHKRQRFVSTILLPESNTVAIARSQLQ